MECYKMDRYYILSMDEHNVLADISLCGRWPNHEYGCPKYSNTYKFEFISVTY